MSDGQHDGRTGPEASGNPPSTPDPLVERLRREAAAHRPSFSSRLHERVMSEVHRQPLRIRPREAVWGRHRAAAAAAILLACVLAATAAALWRSGAGAKNQPRALVAIAPVPPVPSAPAPARPVAVSVPAQALTLDVSDILVVRMCPPGVTMRVPALSPISVARATSAPPASARVATPAAPFEQWLVARLEQPSAEASETLLDLMPPEVRAVLSAARLRGWVRFRQG